MDMKNKREDGEHVRSKEEVKRLWKSYFDE